MLHTEPAHPLVAWGSAHTTPHAPQLRESLRGLTSQPLASIESQSKKPGSHGPRRHALATHEAVAWSNMHARPQPPQFATSLVGSTHIAPHSVRGEVQLALQRPMSHRGVAPVQAVPHVPQ